MANEAAPEVTSEIRPEVYDEYASFIKQAVREYYARGWKSNRGKLHRAGDRLGQMSRSPRTQSATAQGSRRPPSARQGSSPCALGSATSSGPGGAAGERGGGGLGGRVPDQEPEGDHGEGRALPPLIAETRTKFDEIQGGYRAGRYDAAGRNLMVEGLLKRFLEQVDAL